MVASPAIWLSYFINGSTGRQAPDRSRAAVRRLTACLARIIKSATD